jgi:hypothetical protein
MTRAARKPRRGSGAPSPLVRAAALVAVVILFLLRGWAIGLLVAGFLFGLVFAYEHIVLIVPGDFYEWVGQFLRSPVPYIGLALAWPLFQIAWKPLKFIARDWRRNLEQARHARKMRRYNQQARDFTEAMSRISRRGDRTDRGDMY